MTNTRTWPVKLMYMLIAAALAISLIIIAAPAQKVSADPSLSEWSMVSTPSEEDWVLAPDSNIVSVAVGAGGEVAYAIVEKDGDSYLLASTDGAATWKKIADALEEALEEGEEIDDLLNVACEAANPDFMAVALVVDGDVRVFISDDGGDTFKDTGEVDIPSNMIFAFEISPEVAGERDIAIGGSDGSKGLLFRCTALGDIATSWWDTTAYGDDWETCSAVVDFKFAPSWESDRTVLAATATGSAVLLQFGTWGTVKGWNEDSTLAAAAVTVISGVTVPWSTLGAATAGIAMPLDYSGRNADKRTLWVYVNYKVDSDEIGKIFRVKGTSVKAVIQQVELTPWLAHVSYLGYIAEGKAIAGLLGDGFGGTAACCEGVQVYRNDDISNMDICCIEWDAACKPPTGTLAMASFYVSDSKAYAVALGGSAAYDEGAWSVSFDDGDTWNQLSLVDTYIDYLSDVAVSPDCNKMMLVSANLDHGCGCDSVWLYADNLPEAAEYSDKWLRTWCGQLGAEQYGMLRLAPEETTGDTVYLVDRGTSKVYWNELETLWCWNPGAAATVDSIVDLAVKDKETIYALGADGNVAMSDDYAVGWHKAVDSKVDEGWTIAVLGDDILVGGRDGDVSHSDDGGETFAELEDVPTIDGYVTVAFDSYFDTNDTMYAATIDECSDVSGGVYRWVGNSTEWTSLRAEPYGYTGLVVDRPNPGNPMTSADTGGVLYASYVGEYCADANPPACETPQCWYTGVARMLEPAKDVICAACGPWDYLTVGLTPDVMKEAFYMMPKALKICGCLTADSNSKLFAIDGIYGTDGPGYDMEEAEDGTVWTFEDCYAKKAPDLTGPADGATIASDPCACVNVGFNVKWDRLCDACIYDIQIALDEDFTEIVTEQLYQKPPTGTAPSYYIDKVLDPEVTYYWRARASQAETCQIIHSWWSEPRSLTIAPGPDSGVGIGAPEHGATDTATTKLAFSWSPVASATTYDFVLSPNPDLSAPLVTAPGLTTTAYTYTGTALAYDTPYYWQVKALKDGTVINKSTIGTFRTKQAPTTPVEPIPAPTPFWVWVVIAIGAILVIVVIVLIFRTRRV